jgi:hypothetical protein
MPGLGEKKIQKIVLASTANEPNESDRGWVMIDVAITANLFVNEEVELDPVKNSARLLSSAIKQWNFTTPGTQEVSPITPENVLTLSVADFNELDRLLGAAVTEATKGVSPDLKES